MRIKTNLNGRLRNTSLPSKNGLMPLFDAVVNSIHSIEELSENITDSRIVVEIERVSNRGLGLTSEDQGEITGFKVTDTGVGFNKENMESFETLDTDHKAAKGCRGVGRLLWLKAFDHVDISSVYRDGEQLKKREFLFDASSGVSDLRETPAESEERSTTVHLVGFDKNYGKSVPKKLDAISKSLLEHCLWYFVREGSSPTIIVEDGEERVCLDELYEEYMHASAHNEEIEIKERKFSITHIKFRSSLARPHLLSCCAARRLVTEEKLNGKIPGLYGKIEDGHGEFVYSCYVSSPYLDEKVRAERTGFDIEENSEGLFEATEISRRDIRDGIFPQIRNFLSESLQANIEAGKLRVEEFVANQAPKYRPILDRIPEEELMVDANIPDKELELHLHKHMAELERSVLASGHEVLDPADGEKPEDYRERINEYLEKVTDINKSNLANYVCHRKVIISLLEKALERGRDGKYVTEEVIHQFVMPKRKDSNEVSSESESCNLWLLDEKLVFHDYLASDKPIRDMPVSGSSDPQRPDILAVNFYDQPILFSEKRELPLTSITVVEIKRPMRNDAREDKDPIEQALSYLDRVREGKVTTVSGRPIPNSDSIPGFCYIVCDLTDSIRKRCKISNLAETSDHMGYFGFNARYQAYIEVISFDGLVNSAKKRNSAFFDKLGLPAT